MLGVFVLFTGVVSKFNVIMDDGDANVELELERPWTVFALDNARYASDDSQRDSHPNDGFFGALSGDYPDQRWGYPEASS